MPIELFLRTPSLFFVACSGGVQLIKQWNPRSQGVFSVAPLLCRLPAAGGGVPLTSAASWTSMCTCVAVLNRSVVAFSGAPVYAEYCH